jgi:hypothetical protein
VVGDRAGDGERLEVNVAVRVTGCGVLLRVGVVLAVGAAVAEEAVIGTAEVTVAFGLDAAFPAGVEQALSRRSTSKKRRAFKFMGQIITKVRRQMQLGKRVINNE